MSRTVLYDEEPGRASSPFTCEARRRQSAAVGDVRPAFDVAAALDDAPWGETGGAGLSCGGWALSGVQAASAPATPPASSVLRATGATTLPE